MEQTQQRGIKETRELFRSGVEMVGAVRISRQDNGRVDFPGDIPNFLTPLINLPVAINGADQIPAELRDLDQDEITELKAEFGALVQDPRYQKVFQGLLMVADGIQEIIRDEPES